VNLPLLDGDQDRPIELVLAFTGFRVSSVVTLMRTCLEPWSDASHICATPTSRAAVRRCCRFRPCSPSSLDATKLTCRRLPSDGVAVSLTGARGTKRGAFHINPSTVANVIER